MRLRQSLSTQTHTDEPCEPTRSLANAATFLGVLASGSPNYVSKLLESTTATGPYKVVRPYRSIPQPSSIAGGQPVLKDYQLKGVSWLAYLAENGGNGILADEMGLGKTIQTLALIAYLAEKHGRKGPHLIVCPLSVLGSWAAEIERWLPNFVRPSYTSGTKGTH